MSYEHSFMKKHRLCKVAHEVEFRSVFHAPSPKFKILAIPNVFALGKSYKNGFIKKRDGQNVCTKSRTNPSFYRFFASPKFEILAIPNVLAHAMSYEHSFMKKSDVHNSKSSFDRFFTHRLLNSKYWPFPMY
ncbi:hypothetical protein BHE74_00016373 [Ensete ventricosum]|nr:hypothetical protein BHE74_00016373 [Ensete ventricosum]